MSAAPILPLTPIRYVMENLGIIGRNETVGRNDLGFMLGPLPDDGWFATEPLKFPGSVCPVTTSMIELA